jgi:hypothetical protein
MIDQQGYNLVMETIYTLNGNKISRAVELYKGISPDIEGRYMEDLLYDKEIY